MSGLPPPRPPELRDTITSEERNRAWVKPRMDAAIDEVLDTLDYAASVGVEVDPLATILDRVRARGADIDLSSAPPLMQMILGPMLAE